MKSPVNKFAIKSKLNKDIFDLNARKSSIDVKSRYKLSCLLHMSYFAYACKTEGENDISRLISKTA